MKKYYYLILILSAVFYNSFSEVPGSGLTISGCSVAGTPSLSADSVCYGDSTTLLLTGYLGAIQWQSFNGSIWVNEVAPGSTTDQYEVVTNVTTTFRAIVTEAACDPDTSVSIALTVGIIPSPSAPDVSRCGPGQVTFTGTGSNILQWYADSTGGSPLGSGSPFNTYVPATAIYYLENSSFGGGSGGASPILVTEADLDDNNGGDDIEITNVAPFNVDVTGWKVALGNSYTNITLVNPNVNILSGTLTPGQTVTWNDLASAGNYWGSNILWGGGGTLGGWMAIIDNNDVMRDFAIWGFTSTDIQSANLIIDGISYSLATIWTGDGITNSATVGNSISRNGNMDHDDLSDWVISGEDIGSVNSAMTLPFLGLGCSSTRIPVQVTISISDTVTASASSTSICRNETIILSTSSINSNYTYTWTPDSSLSSTTGASVNATPQSSISYIVIGDDGTCSNRDTIEIDVIPHAGGIASSVSDTVCSGNSAILNLTGYIGSIQWQSNDGSGWVLETDSGSTTDIYIDSPVANTQYNAIVSNPGCPDDSSSTITITALIPSNPVLNDTTICAPSNALIAVTTIGTVSWYTDSVNGIDIYTGNSFSPLITGDTTFYAATKTGSIYRFGPQNNTIGSITQIPAAGYGLQFDVTRECVLDKIYVYPAQAGNLILVLRNSPGGPILDTKTIAVPSIINKLGINLSWSLSPGNDYRIELGAGSISLKYNFTGAAYPYTTAGSPVTITGFVNPNFNTVAQYFFFYDWHILEGCASNRVPIHISTIPGPGIPTVVQHDSTLFSSVSTGNQWYLNGNLLVGETDSTLNITQTGDYEVVVSTPNGCTNSASINITTLAIDELQTAGISVYPNPVSDLLQIKFENDIKQNVTIRLMQITGAIVLEKSILRNLNQVTLETSNLSKGTYLLEIQIADEVFRKVIFKN